MNMFAILVAMLLVTATSNASASTSTSTSTSTNANANANAQNAGAAKAASAKSCEQLKAEIAAKLDAKGVQRYSLEIVSRGTDGLGSAVGTCEQGTKEIFYKRR